MHDHRNGSARTNRWVIAATIGVLFLGAILSRLIEPGVRVEKVTLAGNTPALKFIPTGAGPHPVALLAHGYASSKEAFFRFGEASQPLGLFAIAWTNRGMGRRLCHSPLWERWILSRRSHGRSVRLMFSWVGRWVAAREAKRYG